MEHLLELVARPTKRRHEIRSGKIRALYGHSIGENLVWNASVPPEILLHATDPVSAAVIEREGLRAMGRLYVHLTSDREYAQSIRRSSNVTLEIRAAAAHLRGISFYQANEIVWLVSAVPAEFISSTRARFRETIRQMFSEE
jgi:putative RNA 2'-phosphotransferase